MMRWFKYSAFGSLLIFALAACLLLSIPPWQNRWASQVQVALYDWTGIGGLHRLPYADPSFTRTIRM
jgi:hypothetical protein